MLELIDQIPLVAGAKQDAVMGEFLELVTDNFPRIGIARQQETIGLSAIASAMCQSP